MFRRIELKMKRYISIILGILTSLSISAANFPAEGFSGDGYSDFNVEDYGSDEVGADVTPSNVCEDLEIDVTCSNGETETLVVLAWSDQAYNEGDAVLGVLTGTLAATAKYNLHGEEVTISYPGYLFLVDGSGYLKSESSTGGAEAFIFKMPLEENLAVALMLIMMAAAYGVFRLRKKRANLA
jgi:hypothetical protein